ncbi:MAG: lamin tail domain-containing protein [Myxococcales bacterium]|nr:lamin tail domain-containing protein [Myxococcales bacterium]
MWIRPHLSPDRPAVWHALLLTCLMASLSACGVDGPGEPDTKVAPADTGSESDGGEDASTDDATEDATEDAGADTGAADAGSDTSAPDTTDAGGSICAPNGHHCDGKKILECKADGTPGELYKTCGDKEVCAPLTSDKDLRNCFAKACDLGQSVCSGKTVKACNKWGTNFIVEDCKGFLCEAGKCSDSLKCKANAQRCEGDKLYVCNADGTEDKFDKSCPEASACVQDSKAATASCVEKICVPSQPTCKGEVLTSCSGDGTQLIDGGTDCTKASKSCLVVDGIAKCTEPTCGDGKVNASGGGKTGQPTEQCDLGKNNGKPGFLCSKSCQKLDDSCLTVADCKALSLPPCSLGWGCVAGKCAATPSIAEVCDDDNACTTEDKCVDGSCVGLPVQCDDNNPCTADKCDPTLKKLCVTTLLTNVPCDDNNPCTVGDKCLIGNCTSGGTTCECKKDADCAAFDDGNPCTGTLACDSGSCVVPEITIPSCGPGICVAKAANDKACTEAKGVWHKDKTQCLIPAKSAASATKVACESAGHNWHSADGCRIAACDSALGQCLLKSVFDGTACGDGDACTENDVCAGGKCTGAAVNCDDDNACTDDSCKEKTGCQHTANTSPCSDGNSCTGGDACKDGGCVGKNICACTKNSDCDKYNGKIGGTGADADKPNKCTGTWICDGTSKTCELDPKTVVQCDPSKGTACKPNQCDPTDGACKVVDLPDGATCTDGNGCTPDEACEKGACKGTVKSCDDGNPCTDDVCDPKLGCLSANNKAPCDDGDPCSKDDACGDGACQPGKDNCGCNSDKDCATIDGASKCLGGYTCVTASGKCMWDPSKSTLCGKGLCSKPSATTQADCTKLSGTWTGDSACALTTCDEATGQCKQKISPDGLACSDNSACTLGDTCQKGACTGKLNSCDDKDACTADSCDPKVAGGCVATSLGAGACDDGDLCTTKSVCKVGKCVGTEDLACKDDNPCTKDACQPGKGCVFPASQDKCDDGDSCTIGDKCDGTLGKCSPGAPKNCKDANACTIDKCDGKTEEGCVYLSSKATCDDSDPCTVGEACDVGLCKSTKEKDCDDKESCTVDSCDAKVKDGCVNAGKEDKCDDGNVCTEKDSCIAAKGVCFGLNIDCDDDNLCTADSCDPQKGCQYKPTQGTCGEFAKCVDPGTGVPACQITGVKKVLFSEIYVGDPCDPSDDFVELHNTADKPIDLFGFVLQTRPAGSTDFKDWVTHISFKKGQSIGVGRYLLVARSKAVLTGNAVPDVTGATFALDPDGLQIRLYDKPHTLAHDAVAWGDGAKGGEGKPLSPWPAAHSMERRAATTATAKTMAPWAKDWLVGNNADSGDNSADFVERIVPEPQTSAVYEPACSGTCTGGKFCDYKGKGADSCVADKTCKIGCGPGQACSQIISACAIDLQNRLVLSEVLVHSKGAPKAQYLEIYNAGGKDVDISGLQLFVKDSKATIGSSWGAPVAQVPARTVMPAKHYWIVATPSWAKKNGKVDLVVPTLNLDKFGGTVKLLDPRTDVELDRFGWGKSSNPSGSPLSVSQVPADFPLVRKATANSNSLTMAKGGSEELGGNGYDSNQDSSDWLILLNHTAHSLGSGEYAPACGGKCASGTICNWVKGAEKCVDPTCNGACKAGAVCNIKTGKCDLKVLISQVAAVGPKVKDVINFETNNEFVELYNPGHVPVDIGGLVLRYLPLGDGPRNISPIFPTGKCLNPSNQPCKSSDKDCTCQGEGLKGCKVDITCNTQTIPAKGYLLLVPLTHDPNLPKEDLLHTTLWQMNPKAGAVQLIRTDGSKFPDNTSIADQMCWGIMNQFGCKITPDQPTFDVAKPNCSVMRRPKKCTTAKKMSDASHAHHYSGHGYTTGLYQGADWVTYCPRTARNSSSPMRQP